MSTTSSAGAVAVVPAATATRKKIDLTVLIDDALKNRHLRMVYQPLVSLTNSRLAGFESLVRCQSPAYGAIRPDILIPHAESTGQIVALGEWICERVIADLRRMVDAGFNDVCVSLNISPVQIAKSDICSYIINLLERHQLPPQCLKVELTETALIDNANAIEHAVKRFQKVGIAVWIDDFGTGFASLSQLRTFNPDGLKIDRSFISNIAANDEDFTLCSAVVAMAKRLGLHVVVEGIEDETQLQILSQLGCDAAQGYFLGIPESLERSLEIWKQREQSLN